MGTSPVVWSQGFTPKGICPQYGDIGDMFGGLVLGFSPKVEVEYVVDGEKRSAIALRRWDMGHCDVFFLLPAL